MGGDKGLVGGPSHRVTSSTTGLGAPKQGANAPQHPTRHRDAVVS